MSEETRLHDINMLRAEYIGRIIGIVECAGRVPDKKIVEELQKAVADYREAKAA